MRTLWLACAAMLVGAGSALASTFTYTSAPLSPVSNGGNGATQVTVVFTAPGPPAPGKCVTTLMLKSYNDGARKLRDLKAGGYVIVRTIIKELPNGEEVTIPETYAKVCLKTDGATVTGIYQIYATRTAGTVFESFFADDQETGGADRVEFDLYLGGEVPQVYSDFSSQPGTWQIAP